MTTGKVVACIKDDFGSDDLGVVQEAVFELETLGEIISNPRYVLEFSNRFASEQFPDSQESVSVQLSFWNTIA